ncbi:Hypothetical protein I5071_57870 [Sandaracinus amylolyticus]|nr:Hypothetical protein I5071_57870 [Sandaracinus amylolyticus]
MSLRLVLGSMVLVCACSMPRETPDDASTDAPPSLRAALVRARQAEGAEDPRFFAVPEGDGLALRSGVVAARIEGRGVALRGGEVDARLETRAVRCDAERVAATDGIARIGGRPNRVELERAPGVVEWYESGPLGIEQGFDVDAEGCDELAIELAVLGARAEADGEGARLVGEGGALRYAELFALDARGRALPARMDVTEGAIELVVDAQGAAWPVVVDPLLYVEEQIFGPEGTPGDVAPDVGSSVAMDGDTVVLGAPLDFVGGINDGGSAYVFVRSGGGWALQAKLIPSDGVFGGFGSSVAISGDTIVVGRGTPFGVAYVFVRSGGMWTEQAKLMSDYSGIDHFGSAVAISGDTIAVGAPYDAYELGTRVHVFRRTGTTWAREAILAAGSLERLGWSLSLSGDTLVVAFRSRSDGVAEVYVRSGTTWARVSVLPGASSALRGGPVAWSGDTMVVADSGADALRGAVHVFVRSGETWVRQARLIASEPRPQEQFGTELALSGDELVVTSSALGTQQRLYVFRRSGETWTERQRLDLVRERTSAVALSGDTLLVGPEVFVRAGDTWTLETTLPAEPRTSHSLGMSVAVSGDVAIAGAASDQGRDDAGGAAYLFARSGGVWARQAKLTAPAGEYGFGRSVAVSGETALVGASGEAYVFVRSGDAWVEQATLSVSDPFESFGGSVALSGDVALVGAPYAASPYGGAAHVFVRARRAWPRAMPHPAASAPACRSRGRSRSSARRGTKAPRTCS